MEKKTLKERIGICVSISGNMRYARARISDVLMSIFLNVNMKKRGMMRVIPLEGVPPNGGDTRHAKCKLLLLQMEALKGMTIKEIHRFLFGHFGFRKHTRNEYIVDLKDNGFIMQKPRSHKLIVTDAGRNHFKIKGSRP